MAYTALYRKYRPQHFDDVVGQPVTIQILNNALKNNRISHAYLFSGPRGTGKTTAAKIFARALNCTGENKPCGVCDNCRMALEQNHPDIIEIDAASNNGVDEVRNLIDQIRYSPIEGKYKIFIIDEVHMMSQGAFNALLKTIEEPPEYVIFILATTEPHKVLPTVLSRCLQFEFNKVSNPLIEARLQSVCEKEGIPFNKEALSLIASLSDGGLRDALSILDQCISYDRQISLENVETVFGLTSTVHLVELLNSMSRESINQSIENLEGLYNDGKDLKQLVLSLIRLLKDYLIFRLDNQSPLISQERKELFLSQIPDLPLHQIQSLLEDLIAVSGRLSTNQTTLIRLETILLKNSFTDRISQMDDQIYTESKKIISEPRSEIGLPKSLPRSDILSDLAEKNENKAETESAVSRETQKLFHVESESEDVNLENLLVLLVAANKNERKNDQNNWKNFNTDTDNLIQERLAHSLTKTDIIASTQNQILILADSKRQAQHINALQKSTGFEDFLESRIGKRKSVIAVSPKEKQELMKMFRTRRQSGTLPQANKETPLFTGSQVSKSDRLKELLPELEVIED